MVTKFIILKKFYCTCNTDLVTAKSVEEALANNE